MLVAGSVIIGRREEGKETGAAGTAGAEPTVVTGQEGEGTSFADEPDAPLAGAGGRAQYRDSVELTDQGSDDYGNGDKIR